MLVKNFIRIVYELRLLPMLATQSIQFISCFYRLEAMAEQQPAHDDAQHPWGPHMRIAKVFIKGNKRTRCVCVYHRADSMAC